MTEYTTPFAASATAAAIPASLRPCFKERGYGRDQAHIGANLVWLR